LKNAISYLQQFPQSEYEDICLDAFDLGFLCLQTAQTRHGNELIKQQIIFIGGVSAVGQSNCRVFPAGIS
ncbi:hypothetical protein, partial [Nostoc sp.]|uniref:hypothetical protein n=1 Tax=Nostoc sp. TaxID=1180 RepID=UPI0035941C06